MILPKSATQKLAVTFVGGRYTGSAVKKKNKMLGFLLRRTQNLSFQKSDLGTENAAKKNPKIGGVFFMALSTFGFFLRRTLYSSINRPT